MSFLTCALLLLPRLEECCEPLGDLLELLELIGLFLDLIVGENGYDGLPPAVGEVTYEFLGLGLGFDSTI